MGNKYTEAQKKATAKFMADKHTIRVVVTKSKADEYKAKADAEGKSLNQYIIERVDMDKIFLIFADDIDDYCEIKGYIKGNEEDAQKYCQELNSQGSIYLWEYAEINEIKG